jgi:hypothetical protein
MTVNLTRRASKALNHALEVEGGNRTEVVNRALILYALFSEALDTGAQVCIRRPDGTIEALHII